MPYQKTDWKNKPSTDTPINAARLNKIEDCLFRLSNETTHMIDFPEGGPINATGAICREGDVAQLNMTFYNTQESTVLFAMPVGFHPAMNFDVPVLDANGTGIVALLSYDRVTNNVSVHHSAVSPISRLSKVTVTYVCDE